MTQIALRSTVNTQCIGRARCVGHGSLFFRETIDLKQKFVVPLERITVLALLSSDVNPVIPFVRIVSVLSAKDRVDLKSNITAAPVIFKVVAVVGLVLLVVAGAVIGGTVVTSPVPRRSFLSEP